MHEFLEPTEERISLLAVQPYQAQSAVECKELCAEIEALTKRAHWMVASKTLPDLALAAVIAAVIPFLFGSLVGYGNLISIVASVFVTFGIYNSLPKAFWKRFASKLPGVYRFKGSLQNMLAKVSETPHPSVTPYLLRLVAILFTLESDGIETGVLAQLTTTIDNLLLSISATDAGYFLKRDISLLNTLLHIAGTEKKGGFNQAHFAVVNALKYVGNGHSIRVMRSLLKKPTPPDDMHQVLLRQTMEAAISVIEVRLAREDIHQNLLRPSQLIDEATLLRPSQEQTEPSEELLRPAQEGE
ncbi:MAG: hypothetical protein NT023_09725 [Armatimonadetes bacterium]|nr:hypothetical protein [Armatimonadota bacterium]